MHICCITSPEHSVCVLQVLGTVSLPSDLPGLSMAEWLSAVERRRVTTIARLLNQLSTESSAVITSADTLLTELFSHRGECTLAILRCNPRRYWSTCVSVCVCVCACVLSCGEVILPVQHWLTWDIYLHLIFNNCSFFLSALPLRFWDTLQKRWPHSPVGT